MQGFDSAPDPIAELSDVLSRCGLDMDADNLADLLWLSVHINEMSEGSNVVKDLPETSLNDDGVDDEAMPIIDDPTPSSPPPLPKSPVAPPPVASLQAPNPSRHQTQERDNNGLPFQTPGAKALRKSLALGRSLRPLMRKFPSRNATILDEVATVNVIAERGVCIPVLRPAPERWLSVVLVVEETCSTAIWRENIQDFQTILERLGAFRDVRTWSLHSASDGELQLFSQHYRSSTEQHPRRPKELLDPSGRSLVLLMSDCTSAAWRQGTIHEWVQQWSYDQPVTLVQFLPEKFWERSALGFGISAQLRTFSAGAPNAHWVAEDLFTWEEVDTTTALKLPVVTLEPQSMARWARVMAGFGSIKTAGVLFDESTLQLLELLDGRDAGHVEPEDVLSAEELVSRFQATASPLARRLAGLMAAVPVRLPVVYLIQATMLPASDQVHVAEIFMSGLLEPVTEEGDDLRYDFVDGVRDELLKGVPISDVDHVLDEISKYIARRLGISIRNFMALLTLKPSELEGEASDVIEFATITRHVLRQMGGEYAALVEGASGASLELPYDQIDEWPPFRELDFEVASVVVQNEPLFKTQQVEVVTVEIDSAQQLELFEFTVVTIEKRRGPFGIVLGRYQKRRKTQQAYRFIENLDQNIKLEMVSIPSGNFMMGSPADEKDGESKERPQRRVQVSECFIGRYPITQAQWRVVASRPSIKQELEADPSRSKGDTRPVERVSWYDAVEFCERLSRETGRAYRLPTEAEWEYACRAGTTTPYHFGEILTSELATYARSINEGATPVDHHGIGNAFGLSDMHGNVWEWCQDHWHENYKGAPTDGNAWLTEDENKFRILRGGSWYVISRYCRSAYRVINDPDDRDDFLSGFRVVCGVPRT